MNSLDPEIPNKRTASAENSLKAMAVRGLGWNYAGMVVRSGSSVIIGIVLARLLGPAPFGILAAAWLIVGLGNLVSDFGLGSALVQRPTLHRDDIRFSFTLQILVGLILAGTVFAGAPLFSVFLRNRAAIPVMRVLSIIFMFQACGATAAALLKRDLKFRQLQLVSISSYLIAYLGIGVPMAVLGYGVWSLAAAQVLQSLFAACGYLTALRHSMVPRLLPASAHIWTFSYRVLLTNIVNWLLSNVDNGLVSRYLGDIALGLYSRVFNFLWMPAWSVVSTAQQVLFSAFARAHEEPTARIRSAFLAAFSLVCFSLPLYGTAALIPETIVRATLGTKWIGAITTFVPLAVAMPFYSAMAISGAVINARNLVAKELRIQLTTLTLGLPLIWAAAQFSVALVGWVVTVTYIIRFIVLTAMTIREVGARWTDVGRAARPAVVVSCFTGACAVVVDQLLKTTPASPELRLGFVITAATAAAILVLRFRSGVVLTPELRAAWQYVATHYGQRNSPPGPQTVGRVSP